MHISLVIYNLFLLLNFSLFYYLFDFVYCLILLLWYYLFCIFFFMIYIILSSFIFFTLFFVFVSYVHCSLLCKVECVTVHLPQWGVNCVQEQPFVWLCPGHQIQPLSPGHWPLSRISLFLFKTFYPQEGFGSWIDSGG